MVGETGNLSRRSFLAAAGGTTGALAFAGCTERNPNHAGDGDSDGGTGGGPLSGTIDISGSSTVYPLAVAVSEQFRRRHEEVKVNVRSTGSGGGFKNLFCRGNTAFNNASRPITDTERQTCKSNGVDPVELRVATDALTVLVNPAANWIDSITVEQLKQIWRPDGAQRWSDVDSSWPNEPLELYGPASTSGTFDYFTEAVIGEGGSHRQDYQSTEEDNTIVTGVSGSKHAMGYLGFAFYSENKQKVKALAVDGGDGNPVKPTLENAKQGKYQPLSRPLFTYPSKAELARPEVAEFARFFVKQSANTDLVAGRIGYVPNTRERMYRELGRLEVAIDEASAN